MATFSELEQTGWRRVADGYDSVWGALTRRFVEPLLDAVPVSSDDRVLDVACGPGYVAERAARRGAHVVGVDFSPRMVEIARTRVTDVEFIEGDAADLPVADDDFTAVVNNFGALHLPDPAAAFRDAARTLGPGGRLGFTVWSGPELNPGARIVGDAIATHARPVTLPAAPDFFFLADPDACQTVLAGCGFDGSSVRIDTVTVAWPVPTATYLFEAEKDSGVRTAYVLARQPPAILDRIRDDIAAEMQQFATDDGFDLPFGAQVITAGVR